MPLIDLCRARKTVLRSSTADAAVPAGTLLDRAIKHMQDGTRIPERMPAIFEGLLHGVAAFHEHNPPWAHRHQTANVLLDERDSPVLMDWLYERGTHQDQQPDGSPPPAGGCRTELQHALPRTRALGRAATRPSMAHNVFSLGATLYAMAFYYSPFECTFQDNAQRVVESLARHRWRSVPNPVQYSSSSWR